MASDHEPLSEKSRMPARLASSIIGFEPRSSVQC